MTGPSYIKQYKQFFLTAKAGFIASKIEDASCVGTSEVPSSSNPPAFGCYNRPPGELFARVLLVNINS